MTQATVSYHLSKLKQADLIFESKYKIIFYYEINTSVFEKLVLWLEKNQFGGQKWKLKTVLITCGDMFIFQCLVGSINIVQLPNQIPVHWNVAGEIDGYASKAIFVFITDINEWNSIVMFCC